MRTKWTEGTKVFSLPRQAVRILRELDALRSQSPFVFPSHGQTGHLVENGLEKAHRGLVIQATGREHKPHSWRKVFSTHARDNGAPMVLVENQLAHVTGGGVENVYNKAEYVEPRRSLIQWYADWLDALEAGKALPPLPAMRGFAHYDA